MSFPQNLDTFINPLATNKLNAPSHSAIERAQNSALSNIEAYLGTLSTTSTSTVTYGLFNTLSIDPGHKHSMGSLFDFNVSSPIDGQYFTYSATSGKWENKTISIPAGTFGGNGSDGPLLAGSGTTTVDLGGAATFLRNYTSVSITGTGQIKFINPHANGTVITLKSQGDVTLSSSATPNIDVTGCGATGGIGGLTNNTSGGGLGNNGSTGSTTSAAGDDASHNGTQGNGGNNSGGVSAGSAGPAYTVKAIYSDSVIKFAARRSIFIAPGSGGGGGGSGIKGISGDVPIAQSGPGGKGGNGGGALVIEVGGSLNFAVGASIYANGEDGTAGGPSVNGQIPGYCGGGGGGGGGSNGMVVILYNILIANSGTILTKGGAGGAGGAAQSGGSGSNYGGAGGGGGGAIAAGGGGGFTTNGTNASGAGGGGGGGGGGSNIGSSAAAPGSGGTGGATTNSYFVALNLV